MATYTAGLPASAGEFVDVPHSHFEKTGVKENMGREHTVIAGEHIARIANTYGFFDPETIWRHPQNSALREKRPHPDVLLPGDVVYIPDKQIRVEKLNTGAKHTFRVKKCTVKLRLALKDQESKAIANEQYFLEVQDVRFEGKTAGSGELEHEIPTSAEFGELFLPDRGMRWQLRIGHLNPTRDAPDEAIHASGLRARLNNLCFPVALDGKDLDEQLTGTLRRFQRIALKRDESKGEPDAETLSALEKQHGC